MGMSKYGAGAARRFRGHELFLGSLLVVDGVLLGLFWRPRSFGGDFWLHLWLIQLQDMSWNTFHIPALLASFAPGGALSTAPLFTGGSTYAIAGALQALGMSNYWAAITVALVALNAAFVAIYVSLGRFSLAPLLRASLAFMPLAFGFTFGDGFGRGGLSSMIAGSFAIALVVLVLQVIRDDSPTRGHLIALFLLSFFALSTHLPSAVILVGFGMPLLLMTAIFWRPMLTKRGVRTALVGLGLGALAAATYLVPVLSWALQASKQAQSSSPFQLGASLYFANPIYQWNLLRIVPPEHLAFWQPQTSDGSGTTLVTTLPTLLFAVLAVSLAFTLRKESARQLLGLIVPVAVVIVLLTVPVVWLALPYAFQSLQYSFRVIYLMVPWFVCAIAAVIPLLRAEVRRVLTLVLIGLMTVSVVQSMVQLAQTVNVSILPTGDALKRFVRDVPPSAMLTESGPVFFWYSAGEQQAVDGASPDVPTEGCTYFDSVRAWPSFPGVSGVEIPAGRTCSYLSMDVPMSWLTVKNGSAIGRAPNTLAMIVATESRDQPVSISISLRSPLGIGIGTSLFGLVTFVGAVTCGRRFFGWSRSTISPESTGGLRRRAG